MTVRVGVDTGGTFTDFVVLDEETGAVETGKVPTTGDPAGAVAEGLPAGPVSLLSHGTTVATNALLEERGARTGLLVTRGFRGVAEIGEGSRGTGSSVYDLRLSRPAPLVPPWLTGEIDERVDAQGRVVRPLDEQAARAAIEGLAAQGVEAIAVCLLFSFLHPAHELRVGRLVEEVAPGVRVSFSCQVLPRIREYARLSTTVVDAYVQPRMASYLTSVERHLHGLGATGYVMQSSGGVTPFASAARRPATTILSGPAAGAVAAARIAAAAGFADAVSFDMGGTSTDIALIEGGEPGETSESTIAGRLLGLPMLDIHTISAGGGTLARVDEVSTLQVGPESAGARPGPAAYGRGGERPTVTDASVALGLLPDGTLLGERIRVRADLARAALQRHVAGPLGIDVEEAATAVLRVIDARMEAGLRRVSIERGHDVRDLVLVAFGGAGGLHAASLCRSLGIPRFLLPAHPGLTSALGLLLSDVTREFVRSRLLPLTAGPDLEALCAALEAEAAEVMRAEGFATWESERRVELRFAGQGYELAVPWPRGQDPAALRASFAAAHRRRFGHDGAGAQVEVLGARVRVRVATPQPRIVAPRSGRSGPVRTARVRLPGLAQRVDVPVWDRRAVVSGQEVAGPAILAQPDSTCLLHPGQVAHCDEAGNLVVEECARE